MAYKQREEAEGLLAKSLTHFMLLGWVALSWYQVLLTPFSYKTVMPLM